MTVAVLAALLTGPLAAIGIADLAATRPRRRLHLAAAAARLGRRVGVPRASRDLGHRLEAAATSLPLADAVAAKAGGAAAGLLGALPVAAAAPGRLGLLLPLAGCAAGYLLLDGWLHVRIRRRGRDLARDLPDVVDLLRVAIQAGLPPTRALAEVARRHPGPLAHELGRVASQIALGRPRADALDTLRRRAPIPGVISMAAALERAERLGTPPTEALQALAAEARTARGRSRMEAAARAAPKIQLVVALLLVPSVLLLVAAALAPAVLSAA